jgi:hypothetical protein
MIETDQNPAARLARVFEEILAEVQRNPQLGRRIEEALREGTRPLKSGSSARRRQRGAIDPFSTHAAGGVSGLREALEQLDVEQLKDIVAEHGMDRQKLAMKWKTPARLIDLIVETVSARAKKGDAFRRS